MLLGAMKDASGTARKKEGKERKRKRKDRTVNGRRPLVLRSRLQFIIVLNGRGKLTGSRSSGSSTEPSASNSDSETEKRGNVV